MKGMHGTILEWMNEVKMREEKKERRIEGIEVRKEGEEKKRNEKNKTYIKNVNEKEVEKSKKRKKERKNEQCE